MTAVAAYSNGWAPMTSASAALIPSLQIPLQASSQVGRGQFMSYNSSGNAALNDGATPCLISAGVAYPEVKSDQSTVAAAARTAAWWGFGGGAPMGSSTDAFSASDIGVPFFIKDENTLGKLSNSGGSNRSLGGLVFGLGADGYPIFWSGPVAQLVARSALVTAGKLGAWAQLADGSAGATLSEYAIHREKLHGVVTAIEFIGAAVAADNSDYVTLTVSKRDGAGGGATVLGTYDSRAANQGAIAAFTPAAFSLSAVAGALNLLETDIITLTEAKGGSGKVLTGSVRVIQKVL